MGSGKRWQVRERTFYDGTLVGLTVLHVEPRSVLCVGNLRNSDAEPGICRQRTLTSFPSPRLPTDREPERKGFSEKERQSVT